MSGLAEEINALRKSLEWLAKQGAPIEVCDLHDPFCLHLSVFNVSAEARKVPLAVSPLQSSYHEYVNYKDESTLVMTLMGWAFDKSVFASVKGDGETSETFDEAQQKLFFHYRTTRRLTLAINEFVLALKDQP